MSDSLANGPLKQLASRVLSLPSLPPLHAELTAELRKAEPAFDRVGYIIAQDAGMTAKILQLVNSSFFGLAQATTDVKEAALYLGLETVRALVLSEQVFSQFNPRTIKEFSLGAVAVHCWMTGVLARKIADAEGCAPDVSEQCFMAGLLHDVGYYILAEGMPEPYREVLQMARHFGQSLHEMEQNALGATHAEVGGYLLGLWGLPAAVTEAVALHHRPADASTRGFSCVIAVHVADAFANEMTPGQREQSGSILDLDAIKAHGLEGRLPDWTRRCFLGSNQSGAE